MALQFTNTGITTGQPVEASQVSQSFDAFTGVNAYDVTLSGSLELTGSLLISGSAIFSGSISSSEGFSGSLEGTSSWATNAVNGGDETVQASYLTLGTIAGLTNERVLTEGANITFTDGGPGNTLEIASNSSGETYDLNAVTNGANVDLNLTSTSGTDDSSINLYAGANMTLTANPAGNRIEIASTSAGTIQGGAVAGQVSYGTGDSVIGSEAAFTYNALTNTLSADNFVGSLSGAASETVATQVSTNPNNSGAGGANVRLLLGSGTLSGGSLTITTWSVILSGKTLGTDCFIIVSEATTQAGTSGFTSNLNSGLGEITITDKGVGSNADVNYSVWVTV
tara:strand:+ start:1396 stop:2412 length:1017 start_codon:yes stop_codon:yes gene_type:complete